MTDNDNIQAARDYGDYVRKTFSTGHYNAMVIRYCGARGSGKTLLLARYASEMLMFGDKVWSNVPIVLTANAIRHGYYEGGQHGTVRKEDVEKWCRPSAGFVGRKTLPLDWDALYMLSEDLEHGTVIIDEAQYFSDSRSALSLKNKLLNAIVMQVRKRSLNLLYSVKQGDWVDKRLTYETDVEVDCMDVSRTQWGRERNIPSGEMIRCTYWDLSGVITGHSFNPKNPYSRPFRTGMWHRMHMFWGSYDTSKAIELEEMMTPVKMDMKARVISNKQSEDDIRESLYHVARHIRDGGTTEIATRDFQNVANKMGIDGSMQYLGRFLTDMGIERRQKHGGGYLYDLSGLQA